MSLHNHKILTVFWGGAFLLMASLVHAQTQPPETNLGVGEWKELIRKNLPPILTEDNQALVAKLLEPSLGVPLSKNFNPDVAIKNLFGRLGATKSPDCRNVATPQGDIDRSECKATFGTQSGTGKYLELNYSKRMALGNISFLSRPADSVIDPTKLVQVKMTDEEAYKNSLAYLKTNFGLDSAKEIPPPPSNAELPYPVKTIAMGWANEKQEKNSVGVEKIVMLQRGLFVGAGEGLDWIPGPGRAMLVMNDLEVKEAIVRGWQEVIRHPGADPKNAKKRTELIDEIAEDLMASSQGPAKKLSFRIVLATMPSKNGVGLLLPAVQARIAPVENDLGDEGQKSVLTSAGVIREYHLVRLNEQGGDD